MLSQRSELISSPVHVILNSICRLTLDMDACNVQLGCVPLSEKPDMTLEPIRYWSGSFTDAESQHKTTQRDRLAII